MIATATLEQVDRLVDPLDSTGRRCQASHPDVGTCHRRHDHVIVDPWHYAITGAHRNDTGLVADKWRWRDDGEG